MRQHPIPPVTEPTQYRAIGVVRGTYVPSDPEQLTRGQLRTEDGAEIEAVVPTACPRGTTSFRCAAS